MTPARTITLALVFCLVLPALASAQGQVSWAVADRPDEKIETLVSRLEPYLENLPGREAAAGAILYHQIVVAPDEGESRLCENLVLTIEDPAGMPEELLQPRQRGSDEVTSMSAFVRRGAEYRRLLPEEIVHVAGLDRIGRGHFEIAWGDLEKGDVVGWSMVTRSEQPHTFVPIRLAERIPIVIAALTVQSNGKLAYAVRTNGVSLKDVSRKKDDIVDGRGMVVKASANQRPAVEEIPDSLPWPNDYPYMAVYLAEVKVESQNQFLLPGWANAIGWNQNLLNIDGLVRASAEDLGNLEITLSTITTGKTTAAEKTEAVFTWIRDKFELLEGGEYSARGRRDLAEVVKAKQATPLEKTLLMGAVLERLDIEASVAGIRAPEYGEIDRRWPSAQQFSDYAIRTEEGGAVRYWAPQCGSCAPGETPEAWAGADVATYAFASLAAAEEYQEKLREDAMREGQLDIAGVQEEVEKQPWVIFEKIGE